MKKQSSWERRGLAFWLLVDLENQLYKLTRYVYMWSMRRFVLCAYIEMFNMR